MRYPGTSRNGEGATVCVPAVNGIQEAVRAAAPGQHPGCARALPASAGATLAARHGRLPAP